jgi:hypothetical protein
MRIVLYAHGAAVVFALLVNAVVVYSMMGSIAVEGLLAGFDSLLFLMVTILDDRFLYTAAAIDVVD